MIHSVGVESSDDEVIFTSSVNAAPTNRAAFTSGKASEFNSEHSAQRNPLRDDSSFVCPVCFLPYVSDATLKLHLKSHKQHPIGPGPSFFSSLYGSPTKILPAPAPVESIQRHIPLLKRLQPEKFFCSSCSAGFPTPYLLASHSEQCVGNGKSRNKKAGGKSQTDADKNDVVNPRSSVTGDDGVNTKYFCELCQHVRRGKKTILKHFRASHPDFFFCIACSKAIARSAFSTHSCNVDQVIDLEELDSISRSDGGSNSAASNRAVSADSNKSSGSTDLPAAEPPVAVITVKKFLCRACKLQFLRPLDFLSHLAQNEKHNEKKLFPCPFCRLQFDSFDLLDGHECSKAE